MLLVTVYTVLYKLTLAHVAWHSVQCTVYSVQCTVYSVLYKLTLEYVACLLKYFALFSSFSCQLYRKVSIQYYLSFLLKKICILFQIFEKKIFLRNYQIILLEEMNENVNMSSNCRVNNGKHLNSILFYCLEHLDS